MASIQAQQLLTGLCPPHGYLPPQYENGLSGSGHGTHEALQFISTLESHGIPCCLVGVSALVYYGAERLRHDWEICVPTDALNDAVNLLSTKDLASLYPPTQNHPMPQPASLAHTYPRYRKLGSRVEFVLVTSHDAHLPFDRSMIQRSSNGLPYPTLPTLVQSFVDTNNEVALCDVIDGTNLSEVWGIENLDLDGSNDLEWAKSMNKRLFEIGKGQAPMVSLFPTASIAKRQLWISKASTKIERLGWTQPSHLFETRFRLKGSQDPWETHRELC